MGTFRVCQEGLEWDPVIFIFRDSILSSVQTCPLAIPTDSDTVSQTPATLVSTLSTPPASLNSGRESSQTNPSSSRSAIVTVKLPLACEAIFHHLDSKRCCNRLQ